MVPPSYRSKPSQSHGTTGSFATYRRGLFAGKNQTLQTLRLLKQDKADVVATVLSTALSIPATRPYLFPSPFPQRWSALARFAPSFGVGSLETELIWEFTSLSAFAPKLSDFLVLKGRFENALFLENYSEATACLQEL